MDIDINWNLSGCCNRDTNIFLCLYAGYSLLTMFCMNTVIVKPMKLIAIFIHEMGHASAAWLTCGSVDKIEVYQNEGGVTNFRNGWKPAIIPAGYVGVSFWGGIFVALSGSQLGATIAAGVFILALLVCLRYVLFRFVSFRFAHNNTMVLHKRDETGLGEPLLLLLLLVGTKTMALVEDHTGTHTPVEKARPREYISRSSPKNNGNGTAAKRSESRPL